MNRPIVKNYLESKKSNGLGSLGFDKFYKLAQNSFGVKKYARAVDNCRLAVEMAIRQNNLNQAAQAYRLWLESLFELNKFSDVRKVCCDARGKFGHDLGLLYYEFKAAFLANDYQAAGKLGRELINSHNDANSGLSALFSMTQDKLDNVNNVLEEIKNSGFDKSGGTDMEQFNG